MSIWGVVRIADAPFGHLIINGLMILINQFTGVSIAKRRLVDETSFPFKSGDKVLLKGTNFAGEVTIAKETESKVLFDDENAPDYWYYPNDQLEKLPVEEKK